MPVDREDDGEPSGREHGRKVLIFTATAGGGHVASARAVRDAVARAGHRAVILDGLEVMSRRLKWFQVDCYAWQLEHTPWTYGIGFRILGLPPVAALIRFLIGFLWGDKLLAAIAEAKTDVVVSTYPVVTAGLGRLIAAGRLDLPVVAPITDFGAHPLWVSPHVDFHLAPCRRTLELVEQAGGRGRVMTFPVGERFAHLPSRHEARAALGLPPDAVIPLIVGGTWGVGDIEGTTVAAVAAGAYPVVVTAGNTDLRSRLEARFPGEAAARILGWTDQIPMLMAAADCLIQSAGGVTCLEAMAVGLPILFVKPIAGHGGFNSRIMAEAGAALPIRTTRELETVLHEVVAGAATLAPPACDPGVAVASAVLAALPHRVEPQAPRRIPVVRPLMAAAILALVAWVSFSPWVMALAVERTPLPVVEDDGPPGTVSVVVRTDDPAIAAALEQAIDRSHLPVALFVDARATAGLTADPRVTFGVAEDRLPRTHANPVNRWRRIHATARALEQTTGIAPRYVLPSGDRSDLVDLAVAPRHTRVLVGVQGTDRPLRAGLVVIDTSGLTPADAVAEVEQRLADIAAAGLRAIPLEAMS
ncbi:MAG TPA: glycosyltransferase [Thermomicrobiales bacterium]|jgi:UDP-N-acetylglucosamine:LPS N-acetylglucosamine transferase